MEQPQDEAQQFQPIPSAPFPAPPPFWKAFRAANVTRVEELRANSQSTDLIETPAELLFLTPPPPPPATAQSYSIFSNPTPLSPSPQLPPASELLFNPHAPNLNHAALLSRLTKALLLNFLEFTTVLGNDPTQGEEKLRDIRKIVLNVHVVINMYRPHQAREGVKRMLEDMIEDGEKELKGFDEWKDKVEEFLRVVEREGGSGEGEANGDGLSDKKLGALEKSKRIWDMMEEMDDG